MADYEGKVLFVDEDIDETDAYIEHLKINKIDIKIAIDPAEFKTAIDGEEFDLVILDIMFPRGHYDRDKTEDGRRTGLVLLEHIRKAIPEKAINHNIPVIVRTAVTDNDELRTKCAHLGIREEYYFEKPGNLVKFTKAVKTAIKEFKTYKLTLERK